MGRAISFGIVEALSSICHPEEWSDEGSAVAFRPISGRMAQIQHGGFSNLHCKAGKNQPQILHYVQDDELRCKEI